MRLVRQTHSLSTKRGMWRCRLWVVPTPLCTLLPCFCDTWKMKRKNFWSSPSIWRWLAYQRTLHHNRKLPRKMPRWVQDLMYLRLLTNRQRRVWRTPSCIIWLSSTLHHATMINVWRVIEVIKLMKNTIVVGIVITLRCTITYLDSLYITREVDERISQRWKKLSDH